MVRLNEPILFSIMEFKTLHNIDKVAKLKSWFRRRENHGMLRDIWSFDGETRFVDDDDWQSYIKGKRCIIVSVTLIHEVCLLFVSHGA